MPLYSSFKDYMYNLHTCNSGEARRMWKQTIKEKWDFKCAYCGSEDQLTIDHIIPQCKGGIDFSSNCLCCCKECNKSKGHSDWKEWYKKQQFFTHDRMNAIMKWMEPKEKSLLKIYNPRKTKVY
jgi:hypothetical protein